MYNLVAQWITNNWSWFKRLPWYHKLWGWVVLVGIVAAFILLAVLFAGNPEKNVSEKKEAVVADLVEDRIAENKERDKVLASVLAEHKEHRAQANARIETITQEAKTREDRILSAETFKEIRDAVNKEEDK